MAKKGRKPNYTKWYENYQKTLERKYKNYFLNWKREYQAPLYKKQEFISDINLYYADEKIKSATERIIQDQVKKGELLAEIKVDHIIDNLYRTDIKNKDFKNFQNDLMAVLGHRMTRTKLKELFIKNDDIIMFINSIFIKYSDLFDIDATYYIQ